MVDGAVVAEMCRLIAAPEIAARVPPLIESAKRRAAAGKSGGHLLLLSSIGAQLLMPGSEPPAPGATGQAHQEPSPRPCPEPHPG
jgi:hypothetical protein